jgi:hypothetical protein
LLGSGARILEPVQLIISFVNASSEEDISHLYRYLMYMSLILNPLLHLLVLLGQVIILELLKTEKVSAVVPCQKHLESVLTNMIATDLLWLNLNLNSIKVKKKPLFPQLHQTHFKGSIATFDCGFLLDRTFVRLQRVV